MSQKFKQVWFKLGMVSLHLFSLEIFSVFFENIRESKLYGVYI
jgi:hypothetical protein